jgi:hypothetical protein
MSKGIDKPFLGFRATPEEFAKMERFKRVTGRNCSDVLRRIFQQAELTGVPEIFVKPEPVGAGDANETA